jgi:hypothetical protein
MHRPDQPKMTTSVMNLHFVSTSVDSGRASRQSRTKADTVDINPIASKVVIKGSIFAEPDVRQDQLEAT